MEQNVKQENEVKKPKTWDEAILELKSFILKEKKEAARQEETKKAEENA